MEIEDAYTAFCFDEACAYILSELKDGKSPNATGTVVEAKRYSRPSELYKNFD
jgi:hypothetical protein